MFQLCYKFTGFLFLTLLAGFLNFGYGQPPCTGGVNSGLIVPTPVFQTIACVTGGQYYRFAATAGISYTFSFCQGGGAATWDTQLTILDNTGAYAGGYNDDNCGLQSEITWNAPSTGNFRVLINLYSCTTNATCATLAYRTTPPAGPGATCGLPFIVPSLPFSRAGMTTCGFGDDYSSTDACGDVYMNGDDFVFEYVSPGNEEVTITLTNTGTYVGVFLLDGCPNAGGTICMPTVTGGGPCSGGTATNTNFAGNPFGTWDIIAPGTYYIVVSTYPAPQCTAFDIDITTAPIPGGGGAGVACYNISTPAYAPDPYNGGTAVVFPDDEFSPVLPIGFTFCFMGQNFTQFVISSNGYISFATNCTAQYSPWDTDPLPTIQDDAWNAIHGCWQDIDPAVSGTIRYALYGSAPNRRLVVSYRNIAMFSVACNAQRYTGQITIYETTNLIDSYIANKPTCPTWNNGEAVQGLMDWTGTVSLVVPGRNNTSWTVSNDARRFTPTCAPCTMVLPVLYSSFSGRNNGSENILEWSTTYQENNAKFVVEKSINQKDFSPFETVEGAGNSTNLEHYSATDRSPFSPLTYYRLAQIDQNGNTSYSEVIMVAAAGTELVIENFFFTPGFDNAQLQIQSGFDNKLVTIQISDAKGTVIREREVNLEGGKNFIDLDLTGLSTGYYLVRVSDDRTFSEVKKLIRL